MKFNKNDLPLIVAGLFGILLLWTKTTSSIWDDVYLLVIILIIAIVTIALSGGLKGMVSLT